MSILIQNIIIITICLVAAAFLFKKFYKSFTEKGCSKGCGSCGAIDFKKLEKQIKAEYK